MEHADWPGLNHMTLFGDQGGGVSWVQQGATTAESHKLKGGVGGFPKSRAYYQQRQKWFPGRQKVIDMLYNLWQHKC